MATKIDLSALPSTTALESQILAVLSSALNTPNQTAASTADQLDKLYKDGQDAEEFLWPLWTLYIQVAKRVPADDARLQLLVDTVVSLKDMDRGKVKIWASEGALWGDLPLLGPCMREAWNDRPQPNAAESKTAPWISLNSFAARLLGSKATSWTNFAIWELRSALEEDTSKDSAAQAFNLSTTSEWLTHAGKVLYEQSADPPKLDEDEKRALSPGSLLVSQQKGGDGERSGLSLGRWGFWMGRVEELGGEGALEERAGGLVRAMKALEG